MGPAFSTVSADRENPPSVNCCLRSFFSSFSASFSHSMPLRLFRSKKAHPPFPKFGKPDDPETTLRALLTFHPFLRAHRLLRHHPNGKCCAPFRVAVHFGQHNSGDIQRIVECFSASHRILSRHGIGNKENLSRMHLFFILRSSSINSSSRCNRPAVSMIRML